MTLGPRGSPREAPRNRLGSVGGVRLIFCRGWRCRSVFQRGWRGAGLEKEQPGNDGGCCSSGCRRDRSLGRRGGGRGGGEDPGRPISKAIFPSVSGLGHCASPWAAGNENTRRLCRGGGGALHNEQPSGSTAATAAGGGGGTRCQGAGRGGRRRRHVGRRGRAVDWALSQHASVLPPPAAPTDGIPPRGPADTTGRRLCCHPWPPAIGHPPRAAGRRRPAAWVPRSRRVASLHQQTRISRTRRGGRGGTAAPPRSLRPRSRPRARDGRPGRPAGAACAAARARCAGAPRPAVSARHHPHDGRDGGAASAAWSIPELLSGALDLTRVVGKGRRGNRVPGGSSRRARGGGGRAGGGRVLHPQGKPCSGSGGGRPCTAARGACGRSGAAVSTPTATPTGYFKGRSRTGSRPLRERRCTPKRSRPKRQRTPSPGSAFPCPTRRPAIVWSAAAPVLLVRARSDEAGAA